METDSVDERPTHLDLFSGIGGFALAAQWAGFRTIGFCEIDKYCQKVLAKNFVAYAYEGGYRRDLRAQIQWREDSPKTDTELGSGSSAFGAPIHGNIFNLDGREFSGVDLITGGFPCQPFSVAGKRRGAADDRAIWPEMFRVIREARPAWVLGENVPGIIPMELDNVLSDLEGIGYATRPFVIPACAVDARHRRDRLWIIGRNMVNSERTGLEGHDTSEQSPSIGQRSCDDIGPTSPFAADSIMPERRDDAGNELRGSKHAVTSICGGDNGRTRPENGFCEWQPEPNMGRNFNGLSHRLDEIGLSNEAKIRSLEILRYLWCPDFSETFQREIGRFNGISEAEFLLSFLCEYEEQSDEGWTEMESRKVALTILRNLWREIESSRSPYRRKCRKQFAIECSDALRQLPCEASSLYPQAWSNGCWENGIARVAHKIPNRVDRLKGLGNAIVPQVAYEILREIRKLINRAESKVHRTH